MHTIEGRYFFYDIIRPCKGNNGKYEILRVERFVMVAFCLLLGLPRPVPFWFCGPPPRLRKCIALFMVVKGWLLLDIG